jgi:hypothetical protein
MFRPLNAPLCPKCGSEESKVMGRYTSQDNDCVRERRCLECDHRWKTLQSPEEELHPSVQVRFFRWNSPSGKKRRVTLEYGSKAI